MRMYTRNLRVDNKRESRNKLETSFVYFQWK